MDVNGVYKPSDDTDSYKIVYKCYVRYHGITGEILYIGNIYIYHWFFGGLSINGVMEWLLNHSLWMLFNYSYL
jgi:hypothetical protein